MQLRDWDDLPRFMRCDEVREYYDILLKKKYSLKIKRVFDVTASSIMLVILAIPMLVIAILIKEDSPGPVFYRQERVTAYGKKFWIHKFRTMVNDADKKGSTVTVDNDARITRVGRYLRRLRIDEFPQLLDVLAGDMTFVSTRPEATKYVKKYKKEWFATLLLPAGITSEASIRYKDEARFLNKSDDVDMVYMEELLPRKMEWNLRAIRGFGIEKDFFIIIRTVIALLFEEGQERA